MSPPLLEQTICGTVMLAVPFDPTWVVPIVGAIAAAIALATALINRATAMAASKQQPPELITTKDEPVPDVLLPSRLTRFIDRADVIGLAVAQIRAGDRVLSIEGGAGVGKSAVATELAHRLRSDDEADAVPELHTSDFLWIDGRERGPTLADICQQLTLLTGDQSLSTIADDAKLHALRAHLARRKTVLLLDNVTISRHASLASLLDLLSMVPTGSLVIASVNSSYALGSATRVVLGELEPLHALELIGHETRRSGLTDPGLFDDAFATRLQNAVGGNPRLIESFVRAVTSSPASVDDLLDALERGEGLSELFEPVWDQLQPHSRAVLSACAYLRGQAVAAQLEVACDLTLAKVSAGLTELMGVDLVAVVRSAGNRRCSRAPPPFSASLSHSRRSSSSRASPRACRRTTSGSSRASPRTRSGASRMSRASWPSYSGRSTAARTPRSRRCSRPS